MESTTPRRRRPSALKTSPEIQPTPPTPHASPNRATASSVPGAATLPRPKHPRRTPFAPQNSILSDPASPHSLRGFLVFFWIGMAWYLVATLYHAHRTGGHLLRPELLGILAHDTWTLVFGDLAMVAGCAVAFLIQRDVCTGLVPLAWAGFVGIMWEATWFTYWMVWIWYRRWTWLQTGFMTLHTISNLMKQHSYLMTNTELHFKRQHLATLSASKVALSAETRAHVEILTAELKGRWTGVDFPNQLTFWNFVDYMLVPTLVYELDYPRTKQLRNVFHRQSEHQINLSRNRFQPFALLEKFFSTFLTFTLLCATVDHYILPVLQISKELDWIGSVIYLIMPFMVCFLLLFLIIFECICNAFAELTCFADRTFYEDWWNSSTFDQFARRWNKPVHEFLLRHVYLESISTTKASKESATLVTFFVSSVFHEFAVFMVGKRFRPWLFMFQMLQIPLIYMMRVPFMRKQRLFGNALFWFAMFLGPPLMTALYAREHFLEL
ncbi:MBOAT, membrane-bound O-acyltransferase family-domain-containing protein [Chytriomyces sp. MP71]|nr:MBOAT, membrane-bound O-acyltransferase family-domain-containing protein [Chytriomyces sp. MP71]